MKKRLQYFAKSNQGSTAIEFAFVFPVFMFIILGIVEYSLMFYQRGAIELATHEVLRIGQTRNFNTGGRERNRALSEMLRARIASVMVTGYDPGKLTFNSTVYENYNSISGAWNCQGDGFSRSVCLGQYGNSRITELTVTYAYDFISPFAKLAAYLTNGAFDSTVNIVATGFFKREAPSI